MIWWAGRLLIIPELECQNTRLLFIHYELTWFGRT